MEDLIWRKASKSGNGGNCVEVGSHASEGGGGAFGIRDSKSVERGHLTITPTMLGELLSSVRRGDLDMRLGSPHTDYERPLLTG
jgi:hypothetical protein